MSSVAEEKTYCAVHPDRETALQCNKCGRYMCAQCAVQSPVGYRCRECARGIEDKFFTANQYDPWIIFGICAGLNIIGGFIAWWIGFLIIILVAAFPIGGLISEAALRAVKRRRGRQSAYMAAAGAVIGGLIPVLFDVLSIGIFVPQFYLSMYLYAGLTAAAVYARFQMRI